jgi:hypothetical protein
MSLQERERQGGVQTTAKKYICQDIGSMNQPHCGQPSRACAACPGRLCGVAVRATNGHACWIRWAEIDVESSGIIRAFINVWTLGSLCLSCGAWACLDLPEPSAFDITTFEPNRLCIEKISPRAKGDEA